MAKRKSTFPRDTSLNNTKPMHQLTCMVRRTAQISLFPKNWARRKLGRPKAREGWSNKLAIWKTSHLTLASLCTL